MAENEKNGDSKERLILPPFPLPRLSELIGQDDIRKRLTAAVKAAQSGTARVPHILFDGPPGLGKRTFARSLALELEGEWAATSGAELKQIKYVIPDLTNATKDSVIPIDSIDRIPSAAAAEYLASAMRDFTAPITFFGEGEKERLINVRLRKFTLVGTAAEPGRVNPLLLDQFGIRGHFDFYTPEELSVIIRRAAAHLGTMIDDAAVEIARRSGGRSGNSTKERD